MCIRDSLSSFSSEFYKITNTTPQLLWTTDIKEKQKNTGCVYSDTQTKGRGTHGRTWVSDKGNLVKL